MCKKLTVKDYKSASPRWLQDGHDGRLWYWIAYPEHKDKELMSEVDFDTQLEAWKAAFKHYGLEVICKKPDYETILANFHNGNRKDFALQVKEFGLANFIEHVESGHDCQIIDPVQALEMIGIAVRLGGYD